MLKMSDEKSEMEKIRLGLAEMMGTAILVLMGCSSAANLIRGWKQSIAQALGYGFGLTTCQIAFVQISGCHLNPAVSIAALFLKKITLFDLFHYVIGQLMGGVLGFLALMPYISSSFRASQDAGLCCANIPGKSNAARVVFAELIGTFIWIFMYLSVSDPRNKKGSVPQKMGGTVIACVLALGQYSAGHFNPAFSLGPSLFAREFSSLAFYIGPQLMAAFLTPAFYNIIYGRVENDNANANDQDDDDDE